MANVNLYALLLDVIFAAIALLTVIDAYRKGFLRMAVLLVGYIAAAFLAVYASQWVSDYVYNQFIRESVVSGIEQTVAAGGESLSVGEALNGLVEKLPEFIAKPILSTFGGEDGLIASLEESTNGVLSELGRTVGDVVVAPIVTGILRAFFCLLIFMLCVIIVKMVAALFRRFYTIPILGTLNALLGALLGIVKAGILLVVLALAVSVVISLSADKLDWLNLRIVDATYLLKPLYHIVVQ